MKLKDIVFVTRTPRQIPRTTVIVKRSAKIIEIKGDSLGLEFDFLIDNGHDCDGRGTFGYCWYVEKNCVQAMEPVIQFNHL